MHASGALLTCVVALVVAMLFVAPATAALVPQSFEAEADGRHMSPVVHRERKSDDDEIEEEDSTTTKPAPWTPRHPTTTTQHGGGGSVQPPPQPKPTVAPSPQNDHEEEEEKEEEEEAKARAKQSGIGGLSKSNSYILFGTLGGCLLLVVLVVILMYRRSSQATYVLEQPRPVGARQGDQVVPGGAPPVVMAMETHREKSAPLQVSTGTTGHLLEAICANDEALFSQLLNGEQPPPYSLHQYGHTAAARDQDQPLQATCAAPQATMFEHFSDNSAAATSPSSSTDLHRQPDSSAAGLEDLVDLEDLDALDLAADFGECTSTLVVDHEGSSLEAYPFDGMMDGHMVESGDMMDDGLDDGELPQRLFAALVDPASPFQLMHHTQPTSASTSAAISASGAPARSMIGVQTSPINQCDETGAFPLGIAVQLGNSKFVKQLLAKQADTTVSDHHQRTALHMATDVDANSPTPAPELLDLLLSSSTVAIDLPDDQGATPLLHAVKHHNVEATQTLLRYGANINLKDVTGSSPLSVACAHGQPNLLQALLLADDADVNVPDAKGWAPVHWCASTSSLDCLNLLLLRPDLKVDTRTALNETAMHLAAREGNMRAISMLLTKASDTSKLMLLLAKTTSGHSPADYAEQHNNPDCAEFLRTTHDTLQQRWQTRKSRSPPSTRANSSTPTSNSTAIARPSAATTTKRAKRAASPSSDSVSSGEGSASAASSLHTTVVTSAVVSAVNDTKASVTASGCVSAEADGGRTETRAEYMRRRRREMKAEDKAREHFVKKLQQENEMLRTTLSSLQQDLSLLKGQSSPSTSV
eukprot:m.13440 g.13440  ORF g.13440 m.13440 type:complete len:815 (+) comp5943_c0_seq1:556-3000(+)